MASPTLDGTPKGTSGSSTTSVTVSSFSTMLTNDIVVVLVTMNTTNSTVTVSDTAGLSFTKRGQTNDSKNYSFYALASSVLSGDAITVTVGNATAIDVTVFAVNGANTSAPFDPNLTSPVYASGTNSAPTVSVTTTNADDFIFGFFSATGNPSITPGTGYTTILDEGSTPEQYSEYESVSAAQTSLAVNCTYGVANNWDAVGDAITAGSGGKKGGGSGTNFTYMGCVHGPSSVDTQSFANLCASQCLQQIRGYLDGTSSSVAWAQLWNNAGVEIIGLLGDDPESSPGVLMNEATFKAGVQQEINAYPYVHIWEYGNEVVAPSEWNNISPAHYFQGLVWMYEVVINTSGHANDKVTGGGTETVYTDGNVAQWDGYDGCASSSCVDGWDGTTGDKIGWFKTFWGQSITDSFGTWTPAKILSYISLHFYTNGQNKYSDTITATGAYNGQTYAKMFSDCLNVYYEVAGSSTKVILTEFGSITVANQSNDTPTWQSEFFNDAIPNFFELSSVSSILAGCFFYTLQDNNSTSTDGLFTNPSLTAKSSWGTWSGYLCANGSGGGNPNPPDLVFNPNAGPQGTVVSWALTNGPISDQVRIYAFGVDGAWVNTDSNGNANSSFTVPLGTSPGPYFNTIQVFSTGLIIVGQWFTVTQVIQTGPSSVSAVVARTRSGTVAHYQVFLNGIELEGWESVQTDNTLDLSVNKATIQFPDLVSLNYALKEIGEPVLRDVLITRDGMKFWRGYVQHRTRYLSGSSTSQHRRYVFTCVSNKSYLEREAFRYTGNGSQGGNQSSQPYFDVIYGGAIAQTTQITSNGSTFASAVFQDILNCQKTGILTPGRVGANAGRTQVPHVCLYMIKTYAIQALAQLINASLWEARFNPDNTIDFQNQTGSLTSVKTFNEGDNLVDAQEDYGVDSLVNDVVVSGAGSAQPNPFASTITDYGISAEVDYSPAGGPRFTKFFSMSNIYDKNLLQTYASALAVDLQYSMFTYPLTVVDRLGGVNWSLGDVITLNSPTLEISNALYRIQREQRSFDSQNHEKISLLAMPNIHEASISHTRARALEYLLNSQTMNGQLFQNTVNQQPQAYQNSINLPQNEQSYSDGGAGTYNLSTYGRIALNGLSTGATFGFDPTVTNILNGTATLVSLQAVDLQTGKTYSVSGSPVFGGGPYQATTTDDVYDHTIAIQVTYTLTSGFQGNIFIEGALGVTAPNLPT